MSITVDVFALVSVFALTWVIGLHLGAYAQREILRRNGALRRRR